MINFLPRVRGRIPKPESPMHIGRLPIPILALVCWISSLLPVIAGWKRWEFLTREMRFLFALLAFYLLFLCVELWTSFHGFKNLWMSDVYGLLEFVVLTAVFSGWSSDAMARKAMRSSTGVIVVLWIVGKLSFEPLGGNSNYIAPIETLLLISMALYTIISLVRGNIETLFRQPQFWVSVAVIIFGAGMLPLLILSTKLLSLPLQEYEKVWNVNWVLGVFSNVVYAAAFLTRTPIDNQPGYDLHSAI
jgi:hypothetical protein